MVRRLRIVASSWTGDEETTTHVDNRDLAARAHRVTENEDGKDWHMTMSSGWFADADPQPMKTELILFFLFVLMLHISSSFLRQLAQAQLFSIVH